MKPSEFKGSIANFGVSLSKWQTVRQGSGQAEKLYVSAISLEKGKTETWSAKQQDDGKYSLFRESQEVARGVDGEMKVRETFKILAEEQGYKLSQYRLGEAIANFGVKLSSLGATQRYLGCRIEAKEIGNGKWTAIVTSPDGESEELPLKCDSEKEAMAEARDFISENQ